MRTTLIAALLVLGCRTTSSPAGSTVVAQEEPRAALRPFVLQTAGGEVDAEVGSVRVPENREDAGSREIEVSFVRLASTSEHPGPPIVYLEGGPGLPASLTARFPVWQMLSALRQAGDVILVDQRGTGMSKPSLDCPPVDPPEHALADDERLVQATVVAGRACRAAMIERGVDLDGYDTVQSAADIDAIREALGVDQIDVVGFSYGSHLALTVLRNHGAHVRRAVVMGVAGPDHLRKLPSDVEAQLHRIGDLARVDPCVGPRVPDLVALMRDVHRRAAAEPFMITVSDPKTGESGETPVGKLALQVLAFADMGDTHDFVWFPALYHELSQGRVEMLGKLVQRRFLSGAGMSAMSVAMRIASGSSPERAAAIERELPEGTLGRAVDFPFNEPAFREAWQIPELGPEQWGPLHSDVPTLFLSGTLDGNAPPSRTRPLLAGFPDGAHLIVENAGHEDYFTSDEVNGRVLDFLRTGSANLEPVSLVAPQFLPLPECAEPS